MSSVSYLAPRPSGMVSSARVWVSGPYDSRGVDRTMVGALTGNLRYMKENLISYSNN